MAEKFFWIWCPLIKLRLWFHKIRLSAKLRAAELSRLVTAIKHVTNDRRPPTSFFPCANYYTCAKRVKIHNPWNYIIIMERCCCAISANSMWINCPKNHLVSTYLLTRQKKKKNVSNPFFSCAAENHLTNERFASLSQKVIEQSSKKNLRKRQPNCKSCQEFNKIIVKFTPKKCNIIRQRKFVKKYFNKVEKA